MIVCLCACIYVCVFDPEASSHSTHLGSLSKAHREINTLCYGHKHTPTQTHTPPHRLNPCCSAGSQWRLGIQSPFRLDLGCIYTTHTHTRCTHTYTHALTITHTHTHTHQPTNHAPRRLCCLLCKPSTRGTFQNKVCSQHQQCTLNALSQTPINW